MKTAPAWSRLFAAPPFVTKNQSGILADLQGPKIRTGILEQGKPVRLRFGQRFTITTRKIVGTEEGVSTTFHALPESVHKGDRILAQ